MLTPPVQAKGQPVGTGKVSLQELNLYYGSFHALKNINMEIPGNQVTAFIGPSGCGKSTCIKSINRMNDLWMAAALPERF